MSMAQPPDWYLSMIDTTMDYGIQGATLAFDLLNCTALSWMYVRSNGLAVLERRVGEPASRPPGWFNSGAPRGVVLDSPSRPH